jgi:threonylcarbamoyladenosine tRNA methylthiotransferase MtaB
MKYSIVTFGCRVNQADSLGFEEELRARGVSAGSPEDADLVVVNTCSVTASSDQGARQAIRRIARANPSAQIVVTGCYATRKPDEVRDLPNVVRVVKNDDKPRLFDLVESTTAERFGDGHGGCGAAIEPGLAGRTAYTLRVQTGCAEACTYCIIPSTRGAPRSVPLRSVVQDVRRVAAAGFKEIVLTGVHLGSYGRDLSPSSSLHEFLQTLADSEITDTDDRLVLFRISSLEPMDCTAEIVTLVAEHSSFAPHFHLPLQHASAGVLSRMRRPYTIEHYSRLVDEIRNRIPDAAIGTDVIVGFPGESESDFVELVSYLERSPLTHIHAFPYSDRPGTAASEMANRVPGGEIRERARRVREISDRLRDRFRRSQLGRTHRALTLDDGSVAVTGNYLKVRILPGLTRNHWVDVRITSSGDPMTGDVLNGGRPVWPVAAPAIAGNLQR